MKAAEVVVVGAGIVGASAAYFLSKAGVEVTLIDRKGMLAGGAASQACAGGVRHQGRVGCEMPLALEAIDMWTDLEDELEADLHYRRDGMTIVTDDESLIPGLEQRVAAEQSLGLDIRMVYGSELQDLVSGLAPEMLAGSYCPLDGHADPIRSVAAMVNQAERRGARLEWGLPALGFGAEKGRITSVRTPRGDIPCGHAVLAAGAWSPEIAATVGLELPFRTFGLQMMITPRRAHILDQVLGWLRHGISLKQVPDGGFLIGGGWPGWNDVKMYKNRLLPGSMAKSAQTTLGLFPSLAEVPVLRAWVGLEAFCVDEMQVVGPVPGLEGLFLAAGFSGHGFAIGPGIGALIARYITTGHLSEKLSPFGYERFEGTAAVGGP